MDPLVGYAIGVPLLVIVFYLVFFRTPRKRALAARELPRLAAELGLSFEASDSKDGIGRITGAYRGHALEILPDETTIRLQLHRRPSLRLATHDGKTRFSFGVPALDRFFRTRKAMDGPPSPEVTQALGRLVERWARQIAELSLADGAITVRPRQGAHSDTRFCYLPPALVRGILPDLIAVADALDAGPD